jgi:hypothetical protein
VEKLLKQVKMKSQGFINIMVINIKKYWNLNQQRQEEGLEVRKVVDYES